MNHYYRGVRLPISFCNGGVSTKHIREDAERALDKLEFEIKDQEEHHNTHLDGKEVLGFLEVCEGLVVGSHDKLMVGPLEKVAPVYEGFRDVIQFFVVDGPLLFCCAELLGEVGHQMLFTVVILQEKRS